MYMHISKDITAIDTRELQILRLKSRAEANLLTINLSSHGFILTVGCAPSTLQMNTEHMHIPGIKMLWVLLGPVFPLPF